MTDDKTMLELADAATPGPWEAEDCEGELFVGAGDALTQWEETSSGIRFGTPASSWKSTNRIYEHDLDTWDRGEDADDDQRRADAEFIAATRSWVPDTLQRLEAIKALHRPVEVEPSDTICQECSFQLENGYYFGKIVEYPCPHGQGAGRCSMSSPVMTLGGLIPINLFVDITKLIGEQYPDAQMRNGPSGSYEFVLTPEKEAN